MTFLGKPHRLLRRRPIFQVGNRRRSGQHLAAAVDQVGSRQRADGGLGLEEVAEALRALPDELHGLVDVLRHAERIGADHLAVLLQIGRGDVDRVLDDRLGARGEPVVEATVERHAGEHGKQDCRHDGDHTEQADNADMELRAGHVAASGEP